MKYESRIIIDAPVDSVIELFKDPNNYEKWMGGLQKFEVIQGEFGKEGTVSKFEFKMGKREVTMLETVLFSKLPQQYRVKYEAANVLNYVDHKMETINDFQTLYIVKHEFIFSGIMKFMALMMPGAFKKQSKKYLTDFKKFVESKNEVLVELSI